MRRKADELRRIAKQENQGMNNENETETFIEIPVTSIWKNSLTLKKCSILQIGIFEIFAMCEFQKVIINIFRHFY